MATVTWICKAEFYGGVEVNIKQIELTVPAKGIGYCHIRTPQTWRLTDGKRHPIRIIKVRRLPDAS